MKTRNIIILVALIVCVAAGAGYWVIVKKDDPSSQRPESKDPSAYLTGQWHSEKNEDTMTVQADQTCSFKLGAYESTGSITFRDESSDHSVKFEFKKEPYLLILKRPTKEDGEKPKGWTHGMIFSLSKAASKSGWSPIYESSLKK